MKPHRSAKRDGQYQTGFTLIEVMMSMVVFMVSVVGLVGLQRISVEGAEKSTQHTAAVNIAQYYLSQLRSEISAWTPMPADSVGTCAEAFPNGEFQLCNAQACCGNLSSSWYWMNVSNGGASFRIDPYLGHQELTDNDPQSIFCVNYSARPVDVPTATTPTAGDIAAALIWTIRVRVVWPKRNEYNRGSGWQDCAPSSIDNANRQPFVDVVELVGTATRAFAP